MTLKWTTWEACKTCWHRQQTEALTSKNFAELVAGPTARYEVGQKSSHIR